MLYEWLKIVIINNEVTLQIIILGLPLVTIFTLFIFVTLFLKILFLLVDFFCNCFKNAPQNFCYGNVYAHYEMVVTSGITENFSHESSSTGITSQQWVAELLVILNYVYFIWLNYEFVYHEVYLQHI